MEAHRKSWERRFNTLGVFTALEPWNYALPDRYILKSCDKDIFCKRKVSFPQ
jgi:hypothetical protein